MKKTLITATLYTAITAILLGLGYPLLITGLDHLLFPHQSNGSLITRNGGSSAPNSSAKPSPETHTSTAAPPTPAPATTPHPQEVPTSPPPAKPSSTASAPA